MSARLALCAGALALCGAALADTGTKVVTATIPYTDTNWSLPLAVPQFNVPGGTLTSVDVAFHGAMRNSAQFENLNSSPRNYSANFGYSLVLTRPGGTSTIVLTPPGKTLSGSLSGYDGITDYAGTSGVSYPQTVSEDNSTVTLTGSDAVAFVGSGTLNLPVQASATADISAPGNFSLIVLNQAESDVTVTYHYTYQAPLGSIGDRVFFDANGNGLQDAGEKGVAGVSVSLYNTASGFVGSTTTNADGNYLFSNLPAGSYYVQFVKPTGYAFTTKDAGANDSIDSDADATGMTPTVSLAAGQDRLDVDAGLVGTLCLGDRVFLDCNKDGLNESNEPGFPNVPVHLIDASGTDIADTSTDANGYYKFSNLAPGSYSVKFDAPAAYGFTQPFAKLNGQPATAYDSNPDPATGLATVSLTTNDLTIDAGLVPALKVCGTVWGDCDGDGAYEPNVGEKGFPCVRVWLGTNIDWFGIAHSWACTTTDKDGHYEFDGLTSGNYYVAVNACDLPSGVTPSYDPDGTSWTPNFASLCLSSDTCNFNFGYKPTWNCGGGSHTWWNCNPKCWPTTCLTIGGKCDPKSVICAWLKQTNCSDMSVCLYQRLCAAKLNVANGCNHGVTLSCGRTTCSVGDAILKCDAWMAKHPAGCNVSANCADWASISDCYGILDKFCGK